MLLHYLLVCISLPQGQTETIHSRLRATALCLWKIIENRMDAIVVEQTIWRARKQRESLNFRQFNIYVEYTGKLFDFLLSGFMVAQQTMTTTTKTKIINLRCTGKKRPPHQQSTQLY